VRKNLRAYTLVEVILLTGIITALVMAAIAFFAPQSRKALDAKRKSDLYAIAKILEEYEKDYEIYPAALTWCGLTTSGSPLANYAASLPCDPRTDANYVYEVGPTATSRSWFRVYAALDNSGDIDISQVGCSGGCGPGGSYNYYVASPNAPTLATAGVFPTRFPSPTGGPTATSTLTPTAGGPTSTPTAVPTTPPTSTPTPTPTPGGNLLANPGFESGAANWTGVSGDASISILVFHSGIQSVQINQPAAGQKTVYQNVSVTAGQNYQASGWIRTNAITAGSAMITIIWRDGTGFGFDLATIGQQMGSTNWTQYSQSVTAPTGAVTASFTVGVTWRSSGQAWFDDLVFQ
jgi:type II secretory pathway pseudopilin PulG